MNNKKRALALGLAAAQLATLTSVVAFAETKLDVSNVYVANDTVETLPENEAEAYKTNIGLVESATYTDGTLTIEANVTEMTPYNSAGAGKEGKWIALVLEFNEAASGISATSGWGIADEDKSDVAKFTSSGTAANEIVFWIDAEADNGHSFTLNGSDDSDGLTITIAVEDTYEDEEEPKDEDGKTTVTPGDLEELEEDLVVDAGNGLKWTISPDTQLGEEGVDFALEEVEVTVDAKAAAYVDKEGETTVGFEISADTIIDGATLTFESEATFANLYKVNEDGSLEFVSVVKLTNGSAALAIDEAGKYAVVASDETKKLGDVTNDCKTNTADVLAGLEEIVKGAEGGYLGNVTADNFKFDYNKDGKVNTADALVILEKLANGEQV